MYVPYVIVYDDEPTICSLVSLTDYDSINSIIYSSLFVGNENPLWLVVARVTLSHSIRILGERLWAR